MDREVKDVKIFVFHVNIHQKMTSTEQNIIIPFCGEQSIFFNSHACHDYNNGLMNKMAIEAVM